MIDHMTELCNHRIGFIETRRSGSLSKLTRIITSTTPDGIRAHVSLNSADGAMAMRHIYITRLQHHFEF